MKKPAPSRAVKQAARRYESFTGQRAVKTGTIDVPALPRAVVAIGYVDAIDYETMRHGRIQRFRHRFAKNARPLFACSPNGRTLYMLGGAYQFTARGIVDKRRRKK